MYFGLMVVGAYLASFHLNGMNNTIMHNDKKNIHNNIMFKSLLLVKIV